jgi:hypothetical protein
MKYIKFLLVPMLFVSLAFMNIGGCGGSSGGGGGGGANCQMPALTTNFSDTGYFFTEQGTDVIIGVTSTGLQVAIVVSNFFPETPEIGDLNFIADVVDSDTCDITTQVFFNPDIEVGAGGICLRQNIGEVFRINDLISLGNNLGDITTNREFVADLTTASDINTATREMLDVISNSQ